MAGLKREVRGLTRIRSADVFAGNGENCSRSPGQGLVPSPLEDSESSGPQRDMRLSASLVAELPFAVYKRRRLIVTRVRLSSQ